LRGSFEVLVSSRRLQYKFTIRRNVTVIRGDSATGKTTLIDMIQDYNENGIDSGIAIKCDCKCVTLGSRNWQRDLGEFENSIVFLDEGRRYVMSQEFAEIIRHTSNYYVIVTRERLENIPYSVDEIYGIKTSGKYGELKQSYHEFYRLYENIPYGHQVMNPQTVIAEDSNSGYQFFSGAFVGKKCLSAMGKSNIASLVARFSESVMVIADGAAFGPEMERMTEIMKVRKDIYLYLPESFEWLILQSGLISRENLQAVLASPAEYIDSEKFFSWEQFFTEILTESTVGTVYQYNKKKLAPVYLHEMSKAKILLQMKPFLEKIGW